MTKRPPHVPSPSEYEDDDEGIGLEVRRTLAELSPWAISVAVHLLLVVAAVFLVWSTVLQEQDEPWTGEAAIFKTPDINYQLPEPEPAAEDANDPTTKPTFDSDPSPQPIISPIGSGQPIAGLDLLRRDQPTLPNLDPDRPRVGPPPSGIFGELDRETVFVIDASGSLIDTFPLVIGELKRLLAQLAVAERERLADPRRQNEPPFAYAVVFFRDGEVLTQDRRGLRVAESDAVARSIAWLDRVSPGGSTSPLPAIETALGYHPDTVIVLSDNITGHGQFELNADDLIGRVLQVRGDRRVTVNTVQFLYPDPLEQLGRPGTLRRLAEETGGAYRFVTDRELNLR